jgi:hypothetical protein
LSPNRALDGETALTSRFGGEKGAHVFAETPQRDQLLQGCNISFPKYEYFFTHDVIIHTPFPGGVKRNIAMRCDGVVV